MRIIMKGVLPVIWSHNPRPLHSILSLFPDSALHYTSFHTQHLFIHTYIHTYRYVIHYSAFQQYIVISTFDILRDSKLCYLLRKILHRRQVVMLRQKGDDKLIAICQYSQKLLILRLSFTTRMYVYIHTYIHTYNFEFLQINFHIYIYIRKRSL